MLANSIRRKPTAPSGSPTGGGPCGDPGVGTACGALGRAWPRWVSLSSQGVICGAVGSLAMIDCLSHLGMLSLYSAVLVVGSGYPHTGPRVQGWDRAQVCQQRA